MNAMNYMILVQHIYGNILGNESIHEHGEDHPECSLRQVEVRDDWSAPMEDQRPCAML